MHVLLEAKELLTEDNYLVIYTKGDKLNLVNEDHIGSTGNWLVAKDKEIDYLIIYHRDETNNENIVYTAKYKDKELAEGTDRYKIFFTDVERVANTPSNWAKFIGSNTMNPLSYFYAEDYVSPPFTGRE